MNDVNSIVELIEALGGSTKLCRLLGFKHPSKVSEWKRRNAIPVQYWKAITELTQISDNVSAVSSDELVEFHSKNTA